MIRTKANGSAHEAQKKSMDSATSSSSNGKRPHRKRIKKNRHQTISFMVAVGLLFTGIIFSLKSVPQPRHLMHQSTSNGGPVQPPMQVYKKQTRALINNDLSLTEEQILSDAKEELYKFPVSIGIDTDNSNPDWEWILHPGTEAQKHMHGDSFTNKRRTATDIAKILMRKKSIRDENSNSNSFGNEPSVENGYMRVPRIWDPEAFGVIADLREKVDPSITTSNGEGVRRYLGNFGERLMSQKEAQSIGSHVSTGDGNELETIFITVASYRDWQCSSTVESAFSRATHPERVRIGVVDQIHEKDKPCSIPPGGSCEKNPDQATCRFKDQVDYLTVNSELSVGPVFARHLGHRLYRGEYFALQSDAHITFVTGWDDEIIEQWHSANNEMAVLSTYLSGVEGHINEETGERLSKSRPIMCDSDFEGAGEYKHLRHGQQPEGVPFIHDTPMLNPYWAAGFSFSRGHFVVNVPYDQHLPWIFQGEEISMGLRGFSYGYDYYAAEKSVCYHYYGRKGIPMFWENTSRYQGVGELGMTRLNAIIHMLPTRLRGKDWIKDDALKYGLGKARDVQVFFDTFGIHVQEQSIEHNLCKFVGRPMQKRFIPYLRPNGMGLDYDKIDFRWNENMQPTWDR